MALVCNYDNATRRSVPAGILAYRSSGGLYSHPIITFQYLPDYLGDARLPPVASSLPKQSEAFTFHHDIPPFFDNLISEGWVAEVQAKHLKQNVNDVRNEDERLQDRFRRLSRFGTDLIGSVEVRPMSMGLEQLKADGTSASKAVILSETNVSGYYPKVKCVMVNGRAIPAYFLNRASTHIAKLPDSRMPGILEREYMSIVATRALLPHDDTIHAELTTIELSSANDMANKPVKALVIERFDRGKEDSRLPIDVSKKYAFEELGQLMGKHTVDRRKSSYANAANCIRERLGHDGVKQFYARLLTQFLLGNADSHLKNFALFNQDGNWKMVPNYDLAPSTVYEHNFGLVALEMRQGGWSGAEQNSSAVEEKYSHIPYKHLSPERLIKLGLNDFGLSLDEVNTIKDAIVANIEAAKEAVRNDPNPLLDAKAPSRNKIRVASNMSYREDFCDRLDRRKHYLFDGQLGNSSWQLCVTKAASSWRIH